MKKPRWLLETCERCGAKYSVRAEEMESCQHALCARCKHLPREDRRQKELAAAGH